MPYSIAYDINNADQIVEYAANEMLHSDEAYSPGCLEGVLSGVRIQELALPSAYGAASPYEQLVDSSGLAPAGPTT